MLIKMQKKVVTETSCESFFPPPSPKSCFLSVCWAPLVPCFPPLRPALYLQVTPPLCGLFCLAFSPPCGVSPTSFVLDSVRHCGHFCALPPSSPQRSEKLHVDNWSSAHPGAPERKSLSACFKGHQRTSQRSLLSNFQSPLQGREKAAFSPFRLVLFMLRSKEKASK